MNIIIIIIIIIITFLGCREISVPFVHLECRRCKLLQGDWLS